MRYEVWGGLLPPFINSVASRVEYWGVQAIKLGLIYGNRHTFMLKAVSNCAVVQVVFIHMTCMVFMK